MSNKRTSLPLWKKYDIVNEVNACQYTGEMIGQCQCLLRNLKFQEHP